MNRRRLERIRDGTIRLGLAVVSAFVALTAIGGGLALLTGLETERYPLEDLAATPFTTYTVPALLLAGLVGGSAAISVFACLRPRPHTGSRIAAAGTILMGWIVGEVLILRPPRWSWIEIVYFALGAALLAGALFRPGRPTAAQTETTRRRRHRERT